MIVLTIRLAKRNVLVLAALGAGSAALWSAVNAQPTSRRDACIDNARLLARATMLYAQDYDTFLPPMKSQATFQKAVLPYVAATRNVKPELANGRVFDPTHLEALKMDVSKIKATPKDSKVFRCPLTGKLYLPNAALNDKVAFYTSVAAPVPVAPVDDKPGFPEHAETTWLFQDAARHADGYYTVTFADTHIERLKRPLHGVK